MIKMKQIDWSDKIPASALMGGYHAVQTHEDMDAISEANRAEGMLVCCLDEQKIYILLKDKDTGKTHYEPVTTYSDATQQDVEDLFADEADDPGTSQDEEITAPASEEDISDLFKKGNQA